MLHLVSRKSKVFKKSLKNDNNFKYSNVNDKFLFPKKLKNLLGSENFRKAL